MEKIVWIFAVAFGMTQWMVPQTHAMGQGRQNIHLIEQDAVTGFAMYRVSEPSETDMQDFCKLGITEIMVLSGTGDIDQRLAAKHCPSLKVVYNFKTSAKVPLSEAFLEAFDQWVAKAKWSGKKVAFRCNCGCHRTGRLAAYYHMKHQGWSAQDAIQDMLQKGRHMKFFPMLDNQVRALSSYIHGEPCTEKRKHCVSKAALPQAELEALRLMAHPPGLEPGTL